MKARARLVVRLLVACLPLAGASCSDGSSSADSSSGGGAVASGGASGGAAPAPRGGSGSALGGASGGAVPEPSGGSGGASGGAVPGPTGGVRSPLGGASGAAGLGGAPSGGTTNDAGEASAGAPVAGSAGAAGSGECSRCAEYGTPTESGRVESTELNALSGIASSRTQPGILFAHNDHDRPVVYAIDERGREHSRIVLPDAQASDIEDIAVGPCGAESCVFLADVGDNNAMKREYAILRFVEPVVPVEPGSSSTTVAFERFPFRYEDGSHNAEGVMVGPDGTIYVVTKVSPGSGGSVDASGPSSVYRLGPSLDSGTVAVASKVTTLPVPQAGEAALSAAAAHPCGLGFLLRTYDRVYEFEAPSGMPFEAAFQASPLVLELPDEPQSEGIDYLIGRSGFVTSGEGSRAPIFETTCAP